MLVEDGEISRSSVEYYMISRMMRSGYNLNNITEHIKDTTLGEQCMLMIEAIISGKVTFVNHLLVRWKQLIADKVRNVIGCLHNAIMTAVIHNKSIVLRCLLSATTDVEFDDKNEWLKDAASENKFNICNILLRNCKYSAGDIAVIGNSVKGEMRDFITESVLDNNVNYSPF